MQSVIEAVESQYLRKSVPEFNIGDTVDVHVVIQMEEVHIPQMDVKLYFKQPDKVFIKSEGFALLPREGIFQNPARFNEENFYMELVATEKVDSVMTYKMELIPRTEETMARKITLWIEPEKWVIRRLESISWQGQKTEVRFNYTKVQSEYWLPAETIANLTISGFRGMAGMMQMPKNSDINSNEGRTGKLTIRFSNYKINRGLPDSIFEQEKNKF